ncbi:hypothetical protein EWE75_23855 [Sphingomonas populi]|uniref:Uncharacterized protein n=1 Tax=Sphingomonas populi TaxID=2484750 RepID=A0A4Q6XP16_9SPHN|nr:hypothetical protein [Sphingomonas populi]RZF59054.1 hypothetical protein EWE75_23855 [Sphingomonas populi]
MLKSGQKVPELQFSLATGGAWASRGDSSVRFLLISFYREVLCVVSVDPKDIAQAWVEGNRIDKIPISYGLAQEQIEIFGLFASFFSRNRKEMYFTEPAL